MKTDKSYPLAFTIGVVRVILMTRLKNYADKVECVSPDYFVLTFSEHEVQIKLSEANAGTSLIISSENDKTPSPDEIYFELVNCGLKMEREKAAKAAEQVRGQSGQMQSGSFSRPRPEVYQCQNDCYGRGSSYIRKTNGFAIAGFVLSFFFALLGLIFSIIGYQKSKETDVGQGLSIAGIVISVADLGIILFVFMLVGCAVALS